MQIKKSWLVLLSVGLLSACGSHSTLSENGASLNVSGDTVTQHPPDTYATDVYGQYQAASHGRIAFTLEVLQTGNLKDIEDRSMNDFIGVPAYWIREESRGTELVKIIKEPRDQSSDEWSVPIQLPLPKLARGVDLPSTGIPLVE